MHYLLYLLTSRLKPEETTRLLTRLAQKPGVSSTLILSRSSGAVVQASGLLSTNIESSNSNSSDINVAPDPNLSSTRASQTDREVALNGLNEDTNKQKTGTREAEQVAKLVWNFFRHAGETVEGMFGSGTEGDGEDELRLVRLRTRKSEVVVVPGIWI